MARTKAFIWRYPARVQSVEEVQVVSGAILGSREGVLADVNWRNKGGGVHWESKEGGLFVTSGWKCERGQFSAWVLFASFIISFGVEPGLEIRIHVWFKGFKCIHITLLLPLIFISINRPQYGTPTLLRVMWLIYSLEIVGRKVIVKANLWSILGVEARVKSGQVTRTGEASRVGRWWLD